MACLLMQRACGVFKQGLSLRPQTPPTLYDCGEEATGGNQSGPRTTGQLHWLEISLNPGSLMAGRRYLRLCSHTRPENLNNVKPVIDRVRSRLSYLRKCASTTIFTAEDMKCYRNCEIMLCGRLQYFIQWRLSLTKYQPGLEWVCERKFIVP